MKRLITLPLILEAIVLIHPNEAFTQSGNTKVPVLKNGDNIQWTQIPNSPGGAMTSEFWTDPKTGAHAGLTKFPAGFKAPLHTHTNDTKIVVIKGAYIYNGTKYGPGSYLLIPGGQQHESGGAEDTESIFYLEQPGPFDLNVVQK